MAPKVLSTRKYQQVGTTEAKLATDRVYGGSLQGAHKYWEVMKWDRGMGKGKLFLSLSDLELMPLCPTISS